MIPSVETLVHRLVWTGKPLVRILRYLAALDIAIRLSQHAKINLLLFLQQDLRHLHASIALVVNAVQLEHSLRGYIPAVLVCTAQNILTTNHIDVLFRIPHKDSAFKMAQCAQETTSAVREDVNEAQDYATGVPLVAIRIWHHRPPQVPPQIQSLLGNLPHLPRRIQ